jgi:hypothetical protein
MIVADNTAASWTASVMMTGAASKDNAPARGVTTEALTASVVVPAAMDADSAAGTAGDGETDMPTATASISTGLLPTCGDTTPGDTARDEGAATTETGSTPGTTA